MCVYFFVATAFHRHDTSTIPNFTLSTLFVLQQTNSGPCLLMAPEFEAAAQDLKGKVRFVKLDTDKDEQMATRLNIMGLPTLLFLDKYQPKEGDKNAGASAVLKGRIEGALQKKNIIDLVEHHFFDGPAPKLF
jgi:thiol-disulfide isomerase/thioredoxin